MSAKLGAAPVPLQSGGANLNEALAMGVALTFGKKAPQQPLALTLPVGTHGRATAAAAHSIEPSANDCGAIERRD